MRCCDLIMAASIKADHLWCYVWLALFFFLPSGTLWAQTPSQDKSSLNQNDFNQLGRISAGCYDEQSDQLVLATEAALHGFPLRTLHLADRSSLKSEAESEATASSVPSASDAAKRWSIELDFSHITKCEFSPKRDFLLIAGGDPGARGCVQCLNWPSMIKGQLIENQIDGQPISDVVTHVEWFPNGQQWIESHWNALSVVRRLDGTIQGSFSGHIGPVTCAIPWTDQLAVSCGLDQTIKLWKIQTGELVRSLDNHTAPVIALGRWETPEGKTLLISLGKDRTLRLWDPMIGRLIRFVKFSHAPVGMKLTDGGAIWVRFENNSMSRASLPLLRIVETDTLEPEGSWAWYCP